MAWGVSFFYYYPLKKFFSGGADHCELMESPTFFQHHLGDVVAALIPENYFKLYYDEDACYSDVKEMRKDFSKKIIKMRGLARIVEHGARDKHILVNVENPKTQQVEIFKDIAFDEEHRSHQLVETFHLEVYDPQYDNQEYKYYHALYSVPKKDIAGIKHFRDLLAYRTR